MVASVLTGYIELLHVSRVTKDSTGSRFVSYCNNHSFKTPALRFVSRATKDSTGYIELFLELIKCPFQKRKHDRVVKC